MLRAVQVILSPVLGDGQTVLFTFRGIQTLLNESQSKGEFKVWKYGLRTYSSKNVTQARTQMQTQNSSRGGNPSSSSKTSKTSKSGLLPIEAAVVWSRLYTFTWLGVVQSRGHISSNSRE